MTDVVHFRDPNGGHLGGISLCRLFGMWCLGLRTKSKFTDEPREVTCLRCVRLMLAGSDVAGIA